MIALIMAGGRGTRFWPLSRKDLPKQFQRLFGRRTLLQQTVERLTPFVDLSRIWVACSREHLPEVHRELPGLPDENILAEPEGRNTAPCIGWAAALARHRHGDEPMLVLPADHRIQNEEEFERAVRHAAALAEGDWLVAFGIRPRYASTGYGYLERGESLAEPPFEAYRVARFVEKPPAAQAEEFVRSGRFYWNSGMFAWRPRTILDEIERRLPELAAGIARLAAEDFRPEAVERVFPDLPSISIDYGVMERSDRVACLPCDLGWSDVGGWQSLYELTETDERGNAAQGPCVFLDSQGVMVRGTIDKLTALVGVRDLVIIDTPDALLVCSRERAEEVKDLLKELEDRSMGRFL